MRSSALSDALKTGAGRSVEVTDVFVNGVKQGFYLTDEKPYMGRAGLLLTIAATSFIPRDPAALNSVLIKTPAAEYYAEAGYIAKKGSQWEIWLDFSLIRVRKFDPELAETDDLDLTAELSQ